MAEKVLNTRIQLKYDTYTNWTDANPVLKAGEMALATIQTNNAEVQSAPTVLIKVGDGTHNYNDLPWASAKAADVYAWAKTATKPTYAATEITGLEEFIAGEIQDTNTTYRLVQGSATNKIKLQKHELTDGTGVWTDVGTELTITDAALTGRVTQAETDIDALEALVGETPVATQISTAVSAAKTELIGASGDETTANTIYGAKNYADSLNTAMDTRVDALEAAVGTGGSVDSKIQTAIQALDKADTAVSGQFVTQVSQADGIITVTRKALAASDIPALAISKITDLQTELDSKQDNLVFNSAYDASTNKAATMADVTGAVAGLSGAMHFEGVKESVPASGEGYESGDVILVGNKEYVYDGTSWHELGDESIYAVKGSIVNADIAANAAIDQSKIAGLTAALAAKANTADLGTMAAETATDYVKKTEAPGYDDILTKTTAASTYATQAVVNNKVDKEDGKGLSTNDYTTTEKNKLAGIAAGAQVNVIESVKVNGVALPVSEKAVDVTVPTGALASKNKVSKTDLDTALTSELDGKANSDDLADIATTVNVNDLIQTSGDILVFNCGSATTVM